MRYCIGELRHIDCRVKYLAEMMELGVMEVRKVRDEAREPSELNQLADGLTKAQKTPRFRRDLARLGFGS